MVDIHWEVPPLFFVQSHLPCFIPSHSARLFWRGLCCSLGCRAPREWYHRSPTHIPYTRSLPCCRNRLVWQDTGRTRRITQPPIGIAVQVKHDLCQGRSQEQPDQPELAGDDQDDQQDHRVDLHAPARKHRGEQPVAQEMNRHVEQQDRQRHWLLSPMFTGGSGKIDRKSTRL